MQNRIHALQNPKNCRTASKIVCTLNKSCGFGCQIHHLTYCMIVAIANNRTLVLNSKDWRYVGKSQGTKSLWKLAFKPLSETCLEESGSSRVSWLHGWNHENIQVYLLINVFLIINYKFFINR